jgi:pyruvate dehydrogenase E2 component (dihydrolipoamide acetyltransferase)
MYAFKLPDLGEGIHEGEILKWHVAAGAKIAVDAPLVDIETDKAAVTIPSPVGGAVISLAGKVGDVVLVGQELVVIDDGTAAKIAAPAPAAAKVMAPLPPAAPAAAPAPSAAPPAPAVAAVEARIVPAAPATRRLARELGVDLRRVPSSGPAGRVTVEDIQRFAATASAPAPATAVVEPGHRAEAELAARAASAIPFLDIEPLPDFTIFGPVVREPLRSIRRRVAHKMVTSMILVPHVAHMDEADVTQLEEFRQRENERRENSAASTGARAGGHLTLLAFVVKAVTAGLRATPAFNASLDPFSEEIVYKRYYNIGFAADTGKGLVVPVVKETDRKSILQIATDIEDLARRARAGTIEAGEMRGGTFTITNIGPLGGTALIPAINYPEVAILGMGKVQQKPVVRDGQIVIRTILPLTLAFDHRIADGADAARFVTEMVRQLSDPNRLLLET